MRHRIAANYTISGAAGICTVIQNAKPLQFHTTFAERIALAASDLIGLSALVASFIFSIFTSPITISNIFSFGKDKFSTNCSYFVTAGLCIIALKGFCLQWSIQKWVRT